MTGRSGSGVPAILLGFLLLLVGLAISPGYVDNVDSRIVLRTTERLLDEGSWALGDTAGTYMGSDEYGAEGTDGQRYMKFGPGNAILAAPFVAAGRAVLAPLGLDRRAAGEAGWSLAPALWFALGGVLLFLLAREVAPVRVAVGAVLLHGFCGYGLVYARSAYLETPLTALVVASYLAAMVARRRPDDRRPALLLGLLCGAVLWVKVAAAVLLVGLIPVFFGRGGRRALRGLVPAAAGFAAPVLLLGWLNHARFGSPLATGYAGSARFDTPLVEGVLGLLVSERGGLALFAPGALLGLPALVRLARTDRGLAWGIGLGAVGALPLYGCFFSPYGGDAWGPRYLLPNVALLAIPGAVLLSDWLRGGPLLRGAAAIVISFGATLQLPSTLVSFTEGYTVRAAVAGQTLPPPIPLSARLLVEKVRAGAGPYRIARLGGRQGRWQPPRVHVGLDLWSTRVADRVPRHGVAARAALLGLLLAAGTTGAALAVRLSRTPA